ncbi:DNRLRE domain-containing protein [Brevibacillus composti]|uniref:DNRLRE domain-containing protein n=1 Tax=Brevibacillus composti TaxID=2796470 RepID=A0A7T5END9_9BACL|nr:DNRLRE domain-containing protein [Brevibacillus composti]QQE75732.1 DNRLRE domain-containing protein [Brevibacillus composti]QUO42758.1 DNRLRE domain-containing protein [Brevibacillus composti]
MPSVTLWKNVTSIKDAYVFQANPSYPQAGLESYLYVGSHGGGGAGDIYRSMVYFDLGQIPNNVIINNATLYLNQSQGPFTDTTLALYPLSADWNEITANWGNQPSYNSSYKATATLGTNTGGKYIDVKNIVQAWVNGTIPNYGFLIKDDVESTSKNSFRTFEAKDNTNTISQPQLIIDYTIPSTGKKQVVIESNFASGKGTPSNTFTATIQTANPGDTYIIQVINAVNGNVTTSSPGWVKLGQSWNGFVCAAYFTKIASGGNDSPTFNTTGGNTTWYSQCLRLSNVKSVSQLFNSWSSGNTTQFSATGGSLSASKALMIGMTAVPTSGSWTPPLSANEQYDSYDSTTGTTVSSWAKYMYDKTTYSASDTTSTFSQSNMLMLALFEVQPKTNNPPTLTLTSPTDNQTLAEGNALPIQGTAADQDVNDNVVIKYQINNGPIRNAGSGVSDGSTPISFARTLTYSGKRLYDGTTDVVGSDLAENVDHFLKVWAEDDQGGKSAEVTRNFRVIWNRPPTISGTDTDLGVISDPPSLTYSVSDPEGQSFTITEYLDGEVLRTFSGVAGQEYTVTIPTDKWLRTSLAQHTLKVRATDSAGQFSERTYTFTRTDDRIVFELDEPFLTDAKANRVLFTLDGVIPTGATLLVEACNNAFDAAPTWEDITGPVSAGRGYVFQNTTKTATDWGINIRVKIMKGTATEPVIINGFGGAFD